MRLPILTLLFALLLVVSAHAQQQEQEPTPFTTWIDLHQVAAGQAPTSLPIWLASVTTSQQTNANGNVTTTFQINMRLMPGLDQKRLLRLFFEDRAGASPTVVGLDANGVQTFSRGPLGQSLELPTSDTVVFSTAGIAAIDIIVPGDGRNLRGVFLATLQNHTMMSALDFAPSGDLIDVFERGAALQVPTNDMALYGRIKATLDNGTVKFTDAQPTITWEFELQALPLMCLVNMEILAADPQAPLELTLNDHPLGAVTVSWPDLADPGYVGMVRPLESGMHFRYAGWLRAQKVIPGSALQTGVNRLVLQLPSGASPTAVHNLELLLKHNWKNLDYSVNPATP
ncbi:MAG TPA: hypothetical protein VGM54_01840 [Chthoniobacter sp.]|jgi:hypothetical protein